MKTKHFLSSGILLLLFLCFYSQSQTFKIINKTGETITNVKLSVADKNDWTSVADSTVTLIKNQSYQFSIPVISPGCKYDFRCAPVSKSGKAYVVRGVDLCENSEIKLIIPK